MMMAKASGGPLAIPPVKPKPECAAGGRDHRTLAFVHINKAGGTAMRALLYKYARHQLLEVSQPQAAMALRQLHSRFFHASASLQRRVLGADAWQGAYTFALVRNPFARQLSMFTFLLQEAGCKAPIGVRPSHCEERRLPAAGPWLSDKAQVATKFRSWIRTLADAFPLGTARAHLFGARSHGNELDPWYNASQLSWLVDQSGNLLVDEVVRLEELRARWPRLQKAICGLGATPYNADPQATARRNPSHHEHYSYYYDEPTRRIVEGFMAADLVAFNYTFSHES